MATEQTTKRILRDVRFSYANVWEPRAMEGSTDAKYSVSILIAKTNKAAIAEIEAGIEAAWEIVKDKYKGKKPTNFRNPLRDGDAEKPDDEAYAGCFFLNASSKQPPQILGPDKQKITVQSDFYSGCRGHVSVNFFGYDTAGNKGIGVGLNNLMKTQDDTPLAGRASAESDFATVEAVETNVSDLL